MSDETPHLKVLHLNTEPTWRGGEQQVLYLLDGLAAHEVASEIVAQPGGPMAERARERGHVVHELRMRGEIDAFAVLALSRMIRREGFTIVHAHTSHAHTLGALAAAMVPQASRPQVVVARRVDFSIFRRSFFGLNRLKYLHGVDLYVTVSEAIKQVLIKDGVPAERIECVHSGIDLSRIEAAPLRKAALRQELRVPEGHYLVGNVAHMADHKGQKYLLDAVPRVLARRPNTTFAIVGDGELRGALEAQAVELGVLEHVRFPGFRDDVPSLLKAFDLFVMSSHMEGLGTSVLDALAARCPVVATRAGGIPEIIEHEKSGLLVPSKDPAALAEATIRLLADARLRQAAVEAGHQRVRDHFSKESMVAGTIQVYERLLGLSKPEHTKPEDTKPEDTSPEDTSPEEQPQDGESLT